MPEKIKTLYSNLVDEGYDLPNYDQFLLDMNDDNKRVKFHKSLIEEGYELPDFETFTIDMGIQKKKPFQNPFLQGSKPFVQGVGESVKLPSPSKSPSTSTTTTTTTPKTDKPIQLQQRPKSSTPDFVSPQEITRQLTELGQAPYDPAKERNRIQNGTQGLKNAQIKASQQLIQRDELLAQVEKAKLALEQAKADPQAYNALVPQYNDLLKQVNQVTDNIKGELAKIDIYEKGINATQLKITMNEDTGDARWQAGVNEAKQILLQTLPTTARYMGYFAARTKGIPADMAEKVSTDFVEQNFGGLLDTARELAAENEDLQEIFTKESAWEALKEGDIGKTADLASKELMQTLPATLAIMASYVNPALGATTTIMGTAGTELESMDDENMSPDAKMANALVKGGLEYATEKIFGTIPMVKRAIGAKSKAGQEALQNVILETWNKYAKKMGFGADVIEEVGSEMLNTIGGNYTDYLTGKTDDLQLLKDIGKTFTTSLTMAALLSGGARAIKYSNKDIDKLREDTKKLKEIAASQETTPEVLEVIQENIVKNNEKIGDEAEKEKKVFDSMTEEEWDEATALIQENQSLQEQIEAGEVQPEVLPIIEKKIEENTAQVEAIKDEVKLTLEQRIEALNKLKKQENATQERNIEQSNITEREGVIEQQQGEQENRVNQEEPIAGSQEEAGNSNRIIEGGQEQTQEVKANELTDSGENINPSDKGLEVAEPIKQEGKGQDKGKEKAEVVPALEDVESTAKDTFENREKIEEKLKELGDNVYYHGSSDISYLNSKEDISTIENTKNAESKYLNISPKAGVAISYSIREQKIGAKSGVAAFKLKGKGYTMKNSDIVKLKTNEAYESFYDSKKEEGYDYVKVPQDGNDIVVLNNNAIEYVGKKLNSESLLSKTEPQAEPQEPILSESTPSESKEISPSDIQELLDTSNYQKRRNSNTLIRLPIDFVLKNQEKGFEVKRGNENEIKGRIDRAKKYLQSNPKELEASDIYIKVDGKQSGKIGFSDGRHRLIAAKELGATHAFFEIPKTLEQFNALDRLLADYGNVDGVDFYELTSTEGDFRIIQTSDNTFLLNKGEDIYSFKLNESGGVEGGVLEKNGKLAKKDNQVEYAVQNHLFNNNPEANARNVNRFIGVKDINKPIPKLESLSKKEQKKLDENIEKWQKEDGEPMLGGPQADRSKEQGGEASPELYADKIEKKYPFLNIEEFNKFKSVSDYISNLKKQRKIEVKC